MSRVTAGLTPFPCATLFRSNIRQKLTAIQQNLKAPKGQTNKFGGYSYRSSEDILTAVKPLLGEYECTLVIDDETAFARECESQKGMNEAQITGSASSYARKYALNGLFAIDDTKDPDATNTHGKAPRAKAEPKNDDFL